MLELDAEADSDSGLAAVACMYVCMYIYIYMYRERDRDTHTYYNSMLYNSIVEYSISCYIMWAIRTGIVLYWFVYVIACSAMCVLFYSYGCWY